MAGQLPLMPIMVFTQVGNTSNFFEIPIPTLDLGFNGALWSHLPGPDDPHGPPFEAGDLYAGVDPNTGNLVPFFNLY